MTLGKSLGILAGVFLITLSANIFVPKYQPPVEKDNLEAVVKQIKYDENKPNLAEIHRLIDFIPFRVVVSYKNSVITSNLSKETDDKRRNEGERALTSLDKNIDIEDIKINFEDTNNNPVLRYLNMFLVPALAGLFAGGVYFFIVKKAEDNSDLIQSLKDSLERNDSVIQSYQAKETEFSRKVEKTIPPTVEECQKMIKNQLREKEVILKNMDAIKADFVNSEKDLKATKDQMATFESKTKDQSIEITKLSAQIKQIEDIKEKYDSVNANLREANKKIKEFEKVDVEELREEIKTLKTNLKETNQEKKLTEEKLAELSKIDFEKLQDDNKKYEIKIADLSKKLEDANETISQGTMVNYLKEKDEKERLKKELEEANSRLQTSLSNSSETEVGKLKKDFFELEETHKKLISDSEEVKTKLQAELKLQESKNEGLKIEFKERMKELEEMRASLEEHQRKAKQMESV